MSPFEKGLLTTGVERLWLDPLGKGGQPCPVGHEQVSPNTILKVAVTSNRQSTSRALDGQMPRRRSPDTSRLIVTQGLSSECLRFGPLGNRLSHLCLFADVLVVPRGNHRCLDTPGPLGKAPHGRF